MDYARDLISETFDKEEFEDTKGVIRIRKSKKNRQHNGQKIKYIRTNNVLQNKHWLIKHRNKIAVADSSESRWDTVKRYDANPIANDTNGESFVQSPYKWEKLYSFHIWKTLRRKLKFTQHEPHKIVI